ncbi:MAG: hypothetical protein ACRC4L_02060 [Mycoplasma sp.]
MIWDTDQYHIKLIKQPNHNDLEITYFPIEDEEKTIETQEIETLAELVSSLDNEVFEHDLEYICETNKILTIYNFFKEEYLENQEQDQEQIELIQ